MTRVPVKGTLKKLHFIWRKKSSLKNWPREVAEDQKPGFVNNHLEKGNSRNGWVTKYFLKIWVGHEIFFENLGGS